MSNPHKPHIVMVIARGEAVRNFIYSDTLRVLSQNARVTLLSVIHDDAFRKRCAPYVQEVVPLRENPAPWRIGVLQDVILHAHYRWLWSQKARNKWEILDYQAKMPAARLRNRLQKGTYTLFARPTLLEALTRLYRVVAFRSRSSQEFDTLFRRLEPDLVFNTSHIHGAAADLPVLVASKMGIATAAFIFSWDNLTSRSRILLPYDAFLVWHQPMRDQLITLYPNIDPEKVFITGTPQFDFHFQPRYWLSRQELAARIGFDSQRPYILYTTGMASDFPEEYRHVAAVIEALDHFPVESRPQLVVRTYIKGNSPEMDSLARRDVPGVVFPPILWEKMWFTPKEEDLAVYTSLLRHAALGINPASTVSLELMMHDKPVVNIGFDPPGSQLPHCYRWERHIEFDHYQPVVASGAVMLAKCVEDYPEMIHIGLTNPQAGQAKRQELINSWFGSTLDGQSGQRIAQILLGLATHAADFNEQRASKRAAGLIQY